MGRAEYNDAVKEASIHFQNSDQTATASSGERGYWVLCRSCSVCQQVAAFPVRKVSFAPVGRSFLPSSRKWAFGPLWARAIEMLHTAFLGEDRPNRTGRKQRIF